MSNNKLIISQEYMVYLQILEEEKTEKLKCGHVKRMLVNLSSDLYPNTGAYNTRKQNNFANIEIYCAKFRTQLKPSSVMMHICANSATCQSYVFLYKIIETNNVINHG